MTDLNGKIALSKLVQVDGNYFAPDAAADFRAMDDAYLQEFGRHLDVLRAYMPLGKPGDISPTTQYGANYLQLHGGGFYDVPGRSMHGIGEAVDLGIEADSPEQAWLQSNASLYGWYWGHTAEPGHFIHPS